MAWRGGRSGDPGRRAAADEERVRRGLMPKLARILSRVPFAEDLLAAYYCAFDRETPASVRMTLLSALAYFVLPFDAVPDMLPLVGLTDDAGILVAAIAAVAAHITERHRAAARAALSRLRTEQES